MSSNDCARLISRIEEETTKIWKNKPHDLIEIMNREGTWRYHFSPMLLGESYLAGLCGDLWNLRMAAKNAETDMKTVLITTSIFLSEKVDRTKAWFHLYDLAEILRDTSLVCNKGVSREEYVDLMEKLNVYAGKLEWWIEQTIPWNELSTFYEMIHPSLVVH